MSADDILRLPVGSLISGTVRIPCRGVFPSQCSECCEFEIEDVDKEGLGGELDVIAQQAEELDYRCPECREEWAMKCAREDYDQE